MIEQKDLSFQINNARILYYDFFANLFLYELLQKRKETLSKQIKLLQQFPLDHSNLQDFLKMQEEIENNFDAVILQYTKIFSLPFNLENKKPVALYLSSYKEGCNGGESLVYVKELLKENCFYLDRKISKENEDHLGVLCLFMRYLIQENKILQANYVYQNCIAPMKDLIIANTRQFNCEFYLGVINIFEIFCLLEDSVCGLI